MQSVVQIANANHGDITSVLSNASIRHMGAQLPLGIGCLDIRTDSCRIEHCQDSSPNYPYWQLLTQNTVWQCYHDGCVDIVTVQRLCQLVATLTSTEQQVSIIFTLPINAPISHSPE